MFIDIFRLVKKVFTRGSIYARVGARFLANIFEISDMSNWEKKL